MCIRDSTGSARFVNAMLATSTDEMGAANNKEPIPELPPPNYTRTGVITNVGDRWKIVYNEQFVDPDGSITVNALHMYLLGDIAVGDQILGHVRCSRSPVETSPTTMLSTAKGPPPAAPPDDILPAAMKPTASTAGNDVLPFAVGGGALAAVLGSTALWARRRRRGPDGGDLTEEPPAIAPSDMPA